MIDDLSSRRQDYDGRGLVENELAPDPFEQFQLWLTEAIESGEIYEPTAMTLATASPDGRPSARMVLLKDVSSAGFTFFTNYESSKARDLAANPHASLLFYWDRLHRQVRIEGEVARVSEEESRAYFQSRPRDSQISAWSSKQSAEIESRAALEQSFARHAESFRDREKIDLPPFWGGYRLSPMRFEFWQGRPNRLHDRLQYLRAGNEWKIARLSP